MFVVVCQFILFYVFAIAIFVLFVSLRCLDLDGPSASTCVLYGSLWVDFGSRCLYFVVPKSAPVRDKENTLHRDFSGKTNFLNQKMAHIALLGKSAAKFESVRHLSTFISIFDMSFAFLRFFYIFDIKICIQMYIEICIQMYTNIYIQIMW